MKNFIFILFIFLNFTHLFGQPDVNTSGDNSPAVIAENLSVTYGVRADAIEAILWVYEMEKHFKSFITPILNGEKKENMKKQ